MTSTEDLQNQLKETLALSREFRDLYESNEQAVRDQLINPVLNKLGWKTSDPRFVRPNDTNKDGKIPDYTLRKKGKDILIVEAKNISVEVNDEKILSQLAGYCYSMNLGFDFGILSNGTKWLLFNTFERNPAERTVWIADLETESIQEVSRKLSSFSYDNIEQLKYLIETSKNLEATWDSLVNSPKDIINLLSAEVQKVFKKRFPRVNISKHKIDEFVSAKLNELFDNFSVMEIEPIKKHTEKIKSQEPSQFEEVQEFITRSSRKKIKVTFPDETIVFNRNVGMTFVESIMKIGLENVKSLNLFECGSPLIADKVQTYVDRNGNLRDYNHYEVSPTCFIMTNTSTERKSSILNEINNNLNLQLRIEYV
ncbi:MAG: type I restriction enzyme HsdR N-terminal domain-containing protein [Candidatus Marinimicrobia bacterium]|nr:type I restriction enzyme HsdR N-terminal domain-containing protein [Candidatus Neomarinimicrobiota bacterium]